MQATKTAKPATAVEKLRQAVDLIDDDWDSINGDTAYGIGVSALEKVGIAPEIKGFPNKSAEFELVTMSLARDVEARSDRTRQTVKHALWSAISTLEGLNVNKGNGGFKENRFMETFNDLIADEHLEKALDYLVESLPHLQRSRMNRKEKLKHLTFAGRRLQHAGLGKYGIPKLKGKAKIATSVAEKHGLRNKNLFVDFGCGAHEPLGLASYFYGNGFKRSVANDFLSIRSPEYAALSMYDIISYMRNFPEEFASLDQDPAAFKERMAEFDLKALFNGDFEPGIEALSGKVEFLSCDIRESGLAPNSVSYLVSFAVFEHVMEIESVCKYLFDVTEEGGLHHHFIDLADHRAYRHDGKFNKFSFLTEEDAAPNLNRLRASEHIAAFEAAGFSVLHSHTGRETIPEETRARFLPKWQEFSEEDQEAIQLTVTLRKP